MKPTDIKKVSYYYLFIVSLPNGYKIVTVLNIVDVVLLHVNLD